MDRHFPSDVVLGALLGTLVGLVVGRWWPLTWTGKSGATVPGKIEK
jgi:membrane-associated phospholipid phosphatase